MAPVAGTPRGEGPTPRGAAVSVFGVGGHQSIAVKPLAALGAGALRGAGGAAAVWQARAKYEAERE